MAESGIKGIGVDLIKDSIEVISNCPNSDSWSLGCDITIDDVNAELQEIRVADIILSGNITTGEIAVDIDSQKEVIDLGISAIVNGINSALTESQIVPYEDILKITTISPEATNETRYASSAFSAKAIYDLITFLGRRVDTLESTNEQGGVINKDVADRLDKLEKNQFFERYDDQTIKTKYNLFSDHEISAFCLNAGTGGGSGGEGGASYLKDLWDVTIVSAANNDILVYNGTHWVNKPQSSIMPDLSVLNNYLLKTEAAELYLVKDAAKDFASASSVTDLSNALVRLSETYGNRLNALEKIVQWFHLTQDERAIYTEKNFYSEKEISAHGLNLGGGSGEGGAIELGNIIGVSLHSPVTGDVFVYNGTHWTNISQSELVPDLSGYATTDSVSTVSNRVNTVDNKVKSLEDRLNDLESEKLFFKLEGADDVIYTPYNLFSEKEISAHGLNYGSGSGASGLLTDLLDVKAEDSTRGDLLVFDGTHWINTPQSAIVPSIDTSVIATREWVGQNYASTSDLSNGVKDAKGYTDALRTHVNEQDQILSGQIAKILDWFTLEDGVLLTKYNLASEKEVSAKGINASQGGGTAYNRLDSWSAYDNNKAGYVLSAGLGYGLKVAIDELNGYDLDNRVRSIENSYVSKDAGGVVNGGLVVSSLAVSGGSSSQFLKADGSLDGTSYLSTRGGVISGDLTINGYLINDGHFLFARNTDGAEWIVTDRNWHHNYDIIHSGNVGDYAPAITANQWATSAAFIGEVGTAYIAYRGGSDWSVTDNEWRNEYTLLHSGNVGNYALKTDGSNTMNGGIKWTPNPTPSSWDSYFDVGGNRGLRILNNVGHSTEGAPSNYAVALAVSGYYGFALAYDANGSIFKAKGHDSTDWKTIAFTDSDITGNAGGLMTGASHLYAQHNDTDKYIVFGYQTARNGYSTTIDGTSITFRDGGSNPTMLINSAGNVLIGTTTDNGAGAKLQVESANNVVLSIKGTTYPEASIRYEGSDGKVWTAGKGIMGYGDSFGFYSATVGDDVVRFTTEGAIVNGTLNAGATSLSSLYVSSDIVTNRIIIGGVTLSTEDGVLKIESDMYATGEISAHGLNKGESGGGGSSYSRLDTWIGYDSSKAGYVLSAGLGYDLNTRLSSLSGVVDTHTSRLSSLENAGYITSSALSGYLPTSGGTIKGSSIHPLTIDTYGEQIGIYFSVNGSIKTEVGWDGINGAFLYNYVTGDQISLAPEGGAKVYVNRKYENILHTGNIASYAITTSGGEIKSQALPSLMINRNEGGAVSSIGFKYSDSVFYGYLGFDDVNRPIWMDASYNRYPLIHSGNIGSQSVAYASNAGTLAGVSLSNGSNTPWGTIPKITEAGWMDVGKHFEFHYDNTTGSDYSTVLSCTGNHGNLVSLPSASGTLALLTDNVAGAQKLVDGSGNPIIHNSGAIFYIGDTIFPTIPTNILGSEIVLRYGASATNGLILDSSGNVTIGNGYFAGSGIKLYVDGGGYFSGALTANGGLTVNGILTVGGASIHPTANNPYFQLYQNNNYWYWQADNSYTYIGGTMSKALRIDQDGNTLIRGSLGVTGDATANRLVVGTDGISCNGPATFNDFIYGSSITPRTDNYYVLGNNNYKWYAVTAYNVNVHDAITIEAGKELRFKDDNGVVHTLKYDSTKQAFVFDGNVNATGEMSAKKLNA